MYQNILPKGAEVLVDSKTIAEITKAMAHQINKDYKNKEVVFLTIMNGGMIFASDLSKNLNLDMEMDYLQLSRYGSEQTGGELVWKYQPETVMKGRHVILCDDIYDQGHTLHAAHAWCMKQGAISTKSAVLVHKEHDREYANYKADYVALTIEDHFIFGYGMDLDEKLRQLPEIYFMPPKP